jgi:Spy/CpxP family protein refolding chaperone
MNKTILAWLLAGALAASLSWNWRQLEARTSAGVDCATGSCSIEGLELAPEQRAALEELCARSCRESDRLEREADELQRELLAGLAKPEVDAEASRHLADEVSELRRRSLRSCIEGILEVREVLTPEQIAAMLGNCEQASCK